MGPAPTYAPANRTPQQGCCCRDEHRGLRSKLPSERRSARLVGYRAFATGVSSGEVLVARRVATRRAQNDDPTFSSRATDRLSTAAIEWFRRVVPAFGSLRGYRAEDARADLVAGLTVAAVAVPQAMAYALVAGLPPVYGLYTAIVMTAVGALFDSSRQLINGPTNAISIAVLSVIAVIEPDAKIQAAVALALLVGLIQLGITILRAGDLTRFISHSVIVGFTLGAGVLLVLDQLKNLLGMNA